MSDSKLVKAALAVAKEGLPVFPTTDKRPTWSNKALGVNKGEGGYKIATTDPKRIRELFSHQDAEEIAVPMGEMSGLICVDVDWYKAKEDDQLAALTDWYQRWRKHFDATRAHETRSGGQHLFFKHPGDDYRFPATLRKYVDLKAGGNGYVCWPPTEGYRCTTGKRTTKPFPIKMLEEALIEKGGSGSTSTKSGTFNPETDGELVQAIVEASELYPALRALSYRLAGRTYSRDEQLEIMYGVMDQSVASDRKHPRHDDWLDRKSKIEELVDSAIEKKGGPQISDRALEAMAKMGGFTEGDATAARPIGPQRETTQEDIERRVADTEKEFDGSDTEFVHFTLSTLKKEILPEMQWVVDGMLPVGGLCSLAGVSNVGKTRWLAMLAACLNTGQTEAMQLPKMKAPASVMWIANEEHADDIKRRVKAAAEYLKLKGTAQHGIVVRPKTAGTFRLVALNEIGQPELDEKNIARLVAEIRRMGILVLFLDPYITLSDAMDENSATSAAMVTKAMLMISGMTGCVVVHAHHTPKDRSKDTDWYRGDVGAWRGSGAIYSGLDCGFTLAHYIPKDKAKRRPWKDNALRLNLGRFVVLDTGKIREGKPLEPVLYELEGHDLKKEKYEIGVCAHASFEVVDAMVFNESIDSDAATTVANKMIAIWTSDDEPLATLTNMEEIHRMLKGLPQWLCSSERFTPKSREKFLAWYGDGYETKSGEVFVEYIAPKGQTGKGVWKIHISRKET